MSNELVTHGRAVPVVLNHDENYTEWLQQLPEEKRQRLISSNNRMRTGLHAVAPMTCVGPAKCKFMAHCPLAGRTADGHIDAGPAANYPVGLPCAMESLYMRAKIEEYYAHLQVRVDDPVEVALVNELALLDLYKNRAIMILSTGDAEGQGRDFMRVDTIGITEHGAELKTTQAHPAFEALETLENRRSKLLDKLVMTRKAKIDAQHKLGQKQESSQVLEQLEQVKRLLLRASSESTGGDELKLS